MDWELKIELGLVSIPSRNRTKDRTRTMLRSLKVLLLSAVIAFSTSLVASTHESVANCQEAKASPQGEQAEQDKSASVKEPADSADVDTSTGLTVESAQAALDELEKNSSLDSAAKDLLRPKYKQAIDAVNTAAANSAQAKQYQGTITTAPAEVSKLQSELEKIPSIDDVKAEANRKSKGLGSDAIQNLVDSQRTIVAELNENLTTVTAELARVKLRPAEINGRLTKVESELSKTSEKLASPEMAADESSPGRVAD